MPICKCGRNIPIGSICLCNDKHKKIKLKDSYSHTEIVSDKNSVDKPSSYYNHLWELLHTYKSKSKEETQKWLEEWKNKLSCGRCKKHYEELVKDNPVDFENFFEWGVKIHNLVNNKLDKPEVTVEQAREIWKS